MINKIHFSKNNQRKVKVIRNMMKRLYHLLSLVQPLLFGVYLLIESHGNHLDSLGAYLNKIRVFLIKNDLFKFLKRILRLGKSILISNIIVILGQLRSWKIILTSNMPSNLIWINKQQYLFKTNKKFLKVIMNAKI